MILYTDENISTIVDKLIFDCLFRKKYVTFKNEIKCLRLAKKKKFLFPLIQTTLPNTTHSSKI